MKLGLLIAAGCLLLCASTVHAARRSGISEVFADVGVGRGLLQRSLDCAKVNAGCESCRNQRKPGTRLSELVCSICKPAFRLRRDGTSKICGKTMTKFTITA